MNRFLHTITLLLQQSRILHLTVLPLLIIAVPVSLSGANRRILILAPHEDDEALMCSGIVERALADEDAVEVGLITNGDTKGKDVGLTRIRESIRALAYLGLKADNILFFGYGNTGPTAAGFLNRLYFAATDTTTISSNVGTATYSIPESPEYHYRNFGVHGTYNRATFRLDLESAVREIRPTDIYCTSLYDIHTDHSTLYKFTVETIIALKREDPGFSPRLHEYLIHSADGDGNWPARDSLDDPMVPFSKPRTLDSSTLLSWKKREIVPVPDDMRIVPRDHNRKYLTILKYRSQNPAGNGYLSSFVKSDEVFWVKDFSNIAPLAVVSVSSQDATTDQLGIKAIDGITDGYPRFPDKEWVAQGETVGAWIQLRWPETHSVNRVILYDRPDIKNHVTGGRLALSDGSSIRVGPLPNNGSGLTVSFASKTARWVRFGVTAGRGTRLGLSEFEVYESPPPATSASQPVPNSHVPIVPAAHMFRRPIHFSARPCFAWSGRCQGLSEMIRRQAATTVSSSAAGE